MTSPSPQTDEPTLSPGDDTAGSYPKDERAVAFCAFTDYMKTVFRDSDAYQSLPEAVSAYA